MFLKYSYFKYREIQIWKRISCCNICSILVLSHGIYFFTIREFLLNTEFYMAYKFNLIIK